MGRSPPTATTGIHIPLYKYPDAAGLLVWQAYRDVKLAYPAVPITVIMNPSNGDGWSTPDPNFTNAMSIMKAAGCKVVGYTYASNGSRDVAAIKARIDAYVSCYPGLDGMQVDEMPTAASFLAYMTDLRDYIHTAMPGSTAIGNPGTSVNEALVGCMDLIKIREGSGYPTSSLISTRTFSGAYNKSNFAWTAHTATFFDSALVTATCNMVSKIFITDGTGSNPYSTFSSYVGALASTLQSLSIAGVI